MKKILSLVLVLAMTLSFGMVFADGGATNTNSIMPISNIQTTNNEATIVTCERPIIVKYGDKELQYDVVPQILDGKLMIPLRTTLEELGYKVVWNNKNSSVEIVKGAQFTTLYIGKNEYFKNKMAPMPLSKAPVITNGRTYVPVEFFHEILGLGFSFEDRTLKFEIINPEQTEDSLITHTGYVVDIETTEDGTRYSLSNDKNGEVSLIVNSSFKYTVYQREIKNGDMINVVTYPIMAMSYPGQVGAIVIW